jgi:Leucine-rich repeat (LRR) protein
MVPPKTLKKKPKITLVKSGFGFSLFKGWFTEIRQYFVALVAALTAFLAFKTFVADKLGWPGWTAWLAFAPPVAVFLWTTVPRLVEWRRKRVFIVTAQKDAATPKGSEGAEPYFLIGPYGEEQRTRYTRADGMHVTVLRWLQKTDERILILTGSSGTGKSSLLNAFVIPEVRESSPPWTVVLVRSFDNPLDDLCTQLLKPGFIWEKPPTEHCDLPMIDLVQRAAARLRKSNANARLFAVFDQFEELIVLQTEGSPVVGAVSMFLRELQEAVIDGFSLLLSVRLDYRIFLEPLGVPPLHLGKNWQDVPAFTFSDSARFITAPESGLQIAAERVTRVLAEAAAVDGTRGLIRPIILNMLGKVLGRIAGSPAAEQPTRSLLAIDVRSVVNHKDRQKVARAILPKMLTEADTKRPMPIGKLSEATGMEPQVILGCLLDLELSGYVRQISRPSEIANRVWEVSHDFVARLLGQILRTPFQTFWGRLGRVLYPLSLGVWCLGAIGLFIAAPWLSRMHSEQILRDRFAIFLHDEGHGYLAQAVGSFFGEQELSAAISHLVNFGSITVLVLQNTRLTNVDALKDLKALQTLNLSNCTQLTNFDGLKDLKALQTLYLNGCTQLANFDGLKDLEALQTLYLDDCAQLTKIDGLKDLKALHDLTLNGCTQLTNFDELKDLEALRTLYLDDCTQLTNIDGLKDLKALQTLFLNGCTQLANIDGLKDLRSLQDLTLNGCTQLANIDALKDLKALQTLFLNGCTQLANIDGLKDLKSLQTLTLSDCAQLTNIDGLKDLKSLQSLYLDGCTKLANVDVLKDLNLQTLDLSGCTQVANADVLKDFKSLQSLYLSGCTQLKNVDGLMDLKALQVLFLNGCTQLKNVDGLKDHKALQDLELNGCTQLANVDGLKDLKALQVLRLSVCTQLSPEAMDHLRAALPQTEIQF